MMMIKSFQFFQKLIVIYERTVIYNYINQVYLISNQVYNYVTRQIYIPFKFQAQIDSQITSEKMSYFYSQKMSFCQCMMPRQIAWEVVNQLGKLQIIHFQNSSINYQNPYVKNFKRCEDSTLKLKQIWSFIHQVKPDFKLIEPISYKQALKQFGHDLNKKNIPGYLYINDIEDEIDQIHKYLHSQQKQIQNLKRQEKGLILNASLLLTASNSQQIKQIYLNKKRSDENDLYQISDKKQTSFDFKCFMINKKYQMIVQKGLFRITRGNIWVEILQIPEDRLRLIFPKNNQNLSQKVCLLIVFQKGQSKILLQKIQKFMSCLQTIQLQTPHQKWQSELKLIQSKAKQIHNIEQLTIQSVERYLYRLYESKDESAMSRLKYLWLYIKKQTIIYKQLSSMMTSKSFFHFNIYIPSKDLPLKIHPNANLPPLIMIPKTSISQAPSKFQTPTILQIPQVILNTYGVPSYRQYNPAITYIVTFGFFIGVMFGDVGHMLMAIPLLIYFKANIWMWSILFWMGYCGLIYNQFFGLNLGLFQSCYYLNLNNQVSRTQDCVYAFGIDSIWKVAQNQMQYSNSLKMKIAVIIGVVHMMLGLLIRFLNGFKSKNYVDIILLSVPQTIFMICTFVYMDYLIIYKWFQDYSSQAGAKAPSIISTMISIFAQFGSQEGPIFWPGQRQFQKSLVIICLLMIPIMLLGKPIYIWLCKRQKGNNIHEQIQDGQQYIKDNLQLSPRKEEYEAATQFQKEILQQISSQESLKKQKQIHNINKHEQEPLRQIFVHQFIQTIEYVLGTVSNTASYLRLWALSLAHGQLSEVIFDLILLKMIKGGYSSIIGVLVAFPFFFLVTFGVLICMDSMQCFLHSLRLHWVQFQNKFYKGNGYEFKSFNFKSILNENQNKN